MEDSTGFDIWEIVSRISDDGGKFSHAVYTQLFETKMKYVMKLCLFKSVNATFGRGMSWIVAIPKKNDYDYRGLVY